MNMALHKLYTLSRINNCENNVINKNRKRNKLYNSMMFFDKLNGWRSMHTNSSTTLSHKNNKELQKGLGYLHETHTQERKICWNQNQDSMEYRKRYTLDDNRCMNKQLETEQKLLSITEILSKASHRFLR